MIATVATLHSMPRYTTPYYHHLHPHQQHQLIGLSTTDRDQKIGERPRKVATAAGQN